MRAAQLATPQRVASIVGVAAELDAAQATTRATPPHAVAPPAARQETPSPSASELLDMSGAVELPVETDEEEAVAEHETSELTPGLAAAYARRASNEQRRPALEEAEQAVAQARAN